MLKAYKCKSRAVHELRNCDNCFRFSVIKVDILSCERLAGAVFSMTAPNGWTIRATTNEQGVASFCITSCIPYQLCETTVPCGYQMNCIPISVLIDCCGRVYLDGCCTCNCYVTVPNCPIEKRFCFTVKKVDGDSGAALPGATFDLLLGEQIIDTVTSEQNGDLTFSGLLPGSYRLLESLPPPGYQSNPTPYEVVITNTGEVSINGYPPQEYAIPNVQSFHLSFQKAAVTSDD